MWIIISTDLNNNRHYHVFQDEKDVKIKTEAYLDMGFTYSSYIFPYDGLQAGNFCVIKGETLSLGREIIFHENEKNDV